MYIYKAGIEPVTLTTEAYLLKLNAKLLSRGEFFYVGTDIISLRYNITMKLVLCQSLTHQKTRLMTRWHIVPLATKVKKML